MSNHADAGHKSSNAKPDRAPDAAVAARASPLDRAATVDALARTARLLNTAPAGIAQRALAEAMPVPAAPSDVPIQLYAVHGNAKVSAGGNLALVGDRDLYAGPAQFQQTQGLPGHVAFHATNTAPPHNLVAHVANNLRKVRAELKPNMAGALRIGQFGIATDAQGAVTSPTAQEIQDDYDEQNRAKGNALNQGNRNAYETGLAGLGGPLLPVDCERASLFVTGNHNEAPRNAATQPGSIYELTTHDANAAWTYHYAGVVMQDGTDHVTMENAASRAGENYSKKLMDPAWKYAMYGTAHGQDFHSAYDADLPNGHLNLFHPPAADEESSSSEDEEESHEPRQTGGGKGGGVGGLFGTMKNWLFGTT